MNIGAPFAQCPAANAHSPHGVRRSCCDRGKAGLGSLKASSSDDLDRYRIRAGQHDPRRACLGDGIQVMDVHEALADVTTERSEVKIANDIGRPHSLDSLESDA